MKSVLLLYLKYLSLFFVCWCNIIAADDKQPPTFYEPIFRIYAGGAVTTLDPQNTSVNYNQGLLAHIFDPLFTVRQGEPVPILVDSYEWLSPTQWEFTLKKGVLFHDGSELTSRDIIATFDRAQRLKNYAYKQLKEMDFTALDTYRFRIETETPNSELLWVLEDFYIIRNTAKQGEGESSQSNELIGTGPYQLISQQGFEQFRLKAFLDYHRGAAYIRNVSFQMVSDPKERVQALLKGEADFIDGLTGDLLGALEGKANITNLVGNGLYSLVFDVHRDMSPDIRDNTGNPMQSNPFKDLRVRQAISKALDRGKLIREYYGVKSLAQVAGQLVNSQNKEFSPAMRADNQNIPVARQLLKEAGYPNGFQVTLRDRDDRRRMLELMATMLKKVNITVQVETLPASQFFSRSSAHEFSMVYGGFTTDGNLADMLRYLVHTNGGMNKGRYSNVKLDRQIEKAMKQTSTTRKRRELRKAHEMAIGDMALVPVLFTTEYWAVRLGMVFLPTDQQYPEAYYIMPK